MANFGTVHKKLKLGVKLSPQLAKLGNNLSSTWRSKDMFWIRWRNKELSFMGSLSKTDGFHELK